MAQHASAHDWMQLMLSTAHAGVQLHHAADAAQHFRAWEKAQSASGGAASGVGDHYVQVRWDKQDNFHRL